MIELKDLPKLTSYGNYTVDVDFSRILSTVDHWISEGLIMEPDFQRAHVWTKKQQTSFIEFILRGGQVPLFLFNQPHWPSANEDWFCVDGLQRITAIRAFMNNKIKAYGSFAREYDITVFKHFWLKVCVNNLTTREEVLNWYLEVNAAGTPHTKKDIEKVKQLLEKTKKS